MQVHINRWNRTEYQKWIQKQLVNRFLTKKPRKVNRERHYPFKQMVLAQLDMHILNKEPQPLPRSKWIVKLNVRAKE